MTSEKGEIVRRGRARLKQGRGNWSDSGSSRSRVDGRPHSCDAQRRHYHHHPGRGYYEAFSDWLLRNRFDLQPSQRAKLLAPFGILPEVEAWRATLTPLQRLRLNHPATALRNYRKSTGIGPAPENVTSPPAPASL